jgi:hypothetical protein
MELEFDDELNNLMLEEHTISILKFIRDRQVHDSAITKGDVVRYMFENKICSRPTTLKLIQRLLDHKIIINNKIKNINFSRLSVNPSIDFRSIELNLIGSFIKQVQQQFAGFQDDGDGLDDLLTTLDNFSKKEKKEHEAYWAKQKQLSQSAKLRPEPRITKDGKSSHY